MGFVKFMSSLSGRALRIVAGVIMVLVGLFVLENALGIILGVVGLVMLLAGTLNFCLLAPLFKAPLFAKKIK
jgi:hypothetical protein